MKVEIVAGPELNAAVAEKCGLNSIDVLGLSSFDPSNDVDAAIKAAKKVGLLDAEHFDLYHNRHQGWMVLQSIYEISEGRRGFETIALAICAAVLSYGEK